MKCSACAAQLPDDALFCSACGTELAAAVPPVHGDTAQVALAAANLLRVRGLHDQAEARCIEVLRADPNNVHAHSLLGDIYQDQGRLEDARQWYQLALDLNPNSRPDREKLARLSRTAAAAARGTQADDERLAGVRTVSWVRWLAAVLGVCVLGAIAAVVTDRSPKRSVTSATTPPSRQRPAQALLVAPIPGSRVEDGRMLPGERMSSEPLGDAPEDEGDATVAEREARLEAVLAETLAWRTGASPRAVVLMGAGRSALILFSCEVSRTPPNEESVGLECLRAVHAVLQADPEVQAADVVVRGTGAGVPAHTLFRARALRNNLARDTALAGGADALRQFSWRQWTPVPD